MLILVTGGSGSGKSAYAEQQVLFLGGMKRYYIATMRCRDEESRKRIARHRAMRREKQFETIECPVHLERVLPEEGSTALLECMSNLTANEFFDGAAHTPEEVAERIVKGVEALLGRCRHVVVVTNEIFSDGAQYEKETRDYMQCLGTINRALAERADRVVEVVCGIPVTLKQEKETT